MRPPRAPPGLPPDHAYYIATRDRRTAGLATVPVARKLARRLYHTRATSGRTPCGPQPEPSQSAPPPPPGHPFTDEHAAGSRPGVCCQDLTLLDSLQRMSGDHPSCRRSQATRAPRTEIRLGARCGGNPLPAATTHQHP